MNATFRLAAGTLAVLALLTGESAAVGTAAVDTTPGGPLAATLERVMDAADRRHLLLRSGIGAAPEDLVALEGMTRAEGVAHVVAGLAVEPTRAMPPWTREPPPHHHAWVDLDERERQRFVEARGAEIETLRRWWIDEMLTSASPQTERLVLFWHDLFATSYPGTADAALAMARQNATFRRLGTGSWETLLRAMLRDAALIDYLDADSNGVDAPNENLAREFLELFTLGEGHYTERDVAEAARALTGHASSDTATLAFRLRTWDLDTGDKTLFGVRGAHDGDALVRLALAQPSAARHLATRFWQAFVADGEPSTPWLDAAAARFRASDHDIATLYRHTLSSAAFWAPEHRAAIVRSPLDLVVGTARSLDYPRRDAAGFASLLRELGMDLFAPPDVAGWREGEAFVSGGALLDRRRVVDEVIGAIDRASDGAVEGAVEGAGEGVGDGTVGGGMSGGGMAGIGMSDTGMAAAGTADTGMSDTGMAGGGMLEDGSSGGYPDAPLVLRLAAEHFRGPAVWRVSLREDGRTIWSDHARALADGHDTERDGRLDGRLGMPWRAIAIPAPAVALARADAVAVEFLADFAGPEGDRNLYVDGAIVEGDWIDASDGVQRGECVPEDRSQAGRMFCAGTLLVPRPAASRGVEAARSDSPWRAGAVHVRWANENGEGGYHLATVALDDVATPDGPFHRVQFRLVAPDDGPLELEMDTFDCVPDCIARWPDCAWRDERFPAARRVAFPLDGRADSARERCHLESASNTERALVAALARSAPALLERALEQPSGARHAATLRAIDARLAAIDPGAGDTFVVDAAARPPVPLAPPSPPPPPVLESTPDRLLEALDGAGLGLADVMLAGLPDAVLAPLARLPDENALDAIRRIAAHPAFQLR